MTTLIVKRLWTLGALVLLAFCVVGCKPVNEPVPTAAPAVPNDTRSPVVVDPTRAPNLSTNDYDSYTYSQKSELVAKMREQLSEINREIEKLSVQVERSTGDVKTEGQARIKSLREHSTQLDRQLDKLEGATESAWADVKAGFRKTYDEAKDSFQKSRQWLSEKIAP